MEDNNIVKQVVEFTNTMIGAKIHAMYDEELGKHLFIASEVAKALGYSRPTDAIAWHCGNTVRRRVTTSSANQYATFERERWITFIDEADVYNLIFGSKLKSAKIFKAWITNEVLPTLRQSGEYRTNKRKAELMASDEAIDKAAKLLKEARAKNEEADKRFLKAMEMVDRATNVAETAVGCGIISVASVAKHLCTMGFDISTNDLFAVLRDQLGFLESGDNSFERNLPTRRMLTQSLMTIQYVKCEDGVVRATPRVTGYGFPYIVDTLVTYFVETNTHINVNANAKQTDVKRWHANMIRKIHFDMDGFMHLEERGELRKTAKHWYVDHDLPVPAYLNLPKLPDD